MAVKIKQTHEKEIIALDIKTAIRLRPGMYLGQVSLIEEKIPIIKDNKLQFTEKKWSPGFRHMLVEILENAIDEAKRMKGKMKEINVTVNLNNNEIIIKDTGNGFHKAASKHKVTKKNIVRTAMEELHAGSNFNDSESNILGTHGVGSAVVNILSEYFEITTINKTHVVNLYWEDFELKREDIRKRNTKDVLGTVIRYKPTPEVFKGYKWDKEIVETYLRFKQYLIKNDPLLNNLKLTLDFILNGGKIEIDLNKDFLPENKIEISSKIGNIVIWPSFENSANISFINGSPCTGIHQKIIQDWINNYFDYNLSHHFYNTLISINVPSNLMRFGDQNKSRYDVTRFEIEELLESNFKNKVIRGLKNSEISKLILEKIEDRLHDESVKKLKKAQRKTNIRISKKYIPAVGKKTQLFITEGLSAMGSCSIARDAKTDGLYALKGKIKNIRKLSELASNKEIVDIISILKLDTEKELKPTYTKIIIATDEDYDGYYIESQIVNFFYTWFPYIIKEGYLYRLVTPLVVCDYNKKRKYFYTLKEFEKFTKDHKVSNVNYLKGLGSLSVDDWKWVMNNKLLINIKEDVKTKRYLNIAFGTNAQKRKIWLEGK
jgi:DNA gyrase subunit B